MSVDFSSINETAILYTLLPKAKETSKSGERKDSKKQTSGCAWAIAFLNSSRNWMPKNATRSSQ